MKAYTYRKNKRVFRWSTRDAGQYKKNHLYFYKLVIIAK